MPAESTVDVSIALAGGGTMLREAHRALKGKPLRQEVYAENGLIPTSSFPYSVTMSAWCVRTVQMREGDTPGVLLVYPTETLTYHYERNPIDPRVEQQLTQAVNSCGGVVRAATMQNLRRHRSIGTIDPEQATGQCRIRHTEVIHDISTTAQWHVGLPCRARIWQLQPEATEDLLRGQGDRGRHRTAHRPARGHRQRIGDDPTELTVGTVGARALVHQKVHRAARCAGKAPSDHRAPRQEHRAADHADPGRRGQPPRRHPPPEVEIQHQNFDKLGRPTTTQSPDGGDITALLDFAGEPIFLWKSGHLGIETEVDALRPKVRNWQWDTDAETKALRGRYVFGEALVGDGLAWR